MDIRLPIQFPAIDLSGVLPILLLIGLAAMILFTLLARSIVRSRVVAVVAIVAIVTGSSAFVVGGLTALTTLIAVAGGVVVAIAIVLNRTHDVLDLVRTIVHQHAPRQEPPGVIRVQRDDPEWIAAPPQSPQLPAPHRRRAVRSIRLPKDWGF